MHTDQIFDEAELPLQYVGLSHCFRTEAGAAGRDTAGLYRVHQFTKVEMFVFCTPEQSEAMHLEIMAIEEEIFQGLGLPYHVIDTCTGDLGGPAYRKYDLEAWMPGRGEDGRIRRGDQHVELHRLPGPPARRPLQGEGLQGDAVRPHAQRHGGGVHAGARRDPGELPAGRRSVVIPEVLRPWVGKDRIAAKMQLTGTSPASFPSTAAAHPWWGKKPMRTNVLGGRSC